MARPPGSAIGRYQILGFVARGETSIIYEAREPGSGRAIALKILPPSAMRDPRRVDQFLRLAGRLASLDHAHLLPVVDYGRADGVAFSASPIAQGGSLSDDFEAYRRPGAAVSLVANLARAVAYLHEHDLVHGRIGSEHVLLDAQGRPLLTGAGRPDSSSGSRAPPAYPAPEQGPDRPTDARSDIYQLGALLHHLLLGAPPEPDDSPPEVYQAAGLDQKIVAILTRTLAADPEARFSSAAELADKLAAAGPQQAAPPPAPAPPLAPVVPPIVAPAEPRRLAAPEQTPDAEPEGLAGPTADRNSMGLVIALAGLVVLVAACCLLSMFAIEAISGRLRQPRATAQFNTNVRAGPSVEYRIVGLLRAGEQATIHGVSRDGNWWQIGFAGGPGDRGWVPAAFMTVDRMGNVDVVEPPPPTSEAARSQPFGAVPPS